MVRPWSEWADEIDRTLRSVPDALLGDVATAVAEAELTVTAGNGGSSAIASHAAQAIMKPDYGALGGRAAVCLTDNIASLTAHANDGGWEDALVATARTLTDGQRFGDGCVFLLISSSGKSENLVRLARYARECIWPVIALTGMDGGFLRQLATVSIHIDSRDYEVIEPVHEALIHRIQAHLRFQGQ